MMGGEMRIAIRFSGMFFSLRRRCRLGYSETSIVTYDRTGREMSVFFYCFFYEMEEFQYGTN